jgi:hypothetical protein
VRLVLAATGVFLVSLAGVLVFGLDHPQAAPDPDSTCAVARPTAVQLAECMDFELALGSVGERYATKCRRTSKRDYLCWVYRYTEIVDCRRVKVRWQQGELLVWSKRDDAHCPPAPIPSYGRIPLKQ